MTRRALATSLSVQSAIVALAMAGRGKTIVVEDGAHMADRRFSTYPVREPVSTCGAKPQRQAWQGQGKQKRLRR